MLPQVGHGLYDGRRATWCGCVRGDRLVSSDDTIPSSDMSFCRFTIDCPRFPWA